MNIESNFSDLEKNFDKKGFRNFLDMKKSFRDSTGVKGNPLIYKVYTRNLGTFQMTLTVLEPGKINGEFFMTKGHKHKKPREEIYFLVSGKGKLLIEGKTSNSIEMKEGKFYTIPKEAGHRAVNTGRKKFKFVSIYSKDAGHDYNFKFKKRFFDKEKKKK